jgi:hypothetical protein
MNQPINDGGPAFPTMDPNEHYRLMGMTLRDYFAAAALKGQAHRFAHPHEHRELLAQDCYDIADAMLKAREAKL